MICLKEIELGQKARRLTLAEEEAVADVDERSSVQVLVDSASAQTVVNEFLANWESPALKGNAPTARRL